MAELKRILIEVVVVAVLGLVVGLTANAMNPDGLSLGRDYFRATARGPGPGPSPVGGTQPAPGTAEADPAPDTQPAEPSGAGTGQATAGTGQTGTIPPPHGTGAAMGGTTDVSDQVAEDLKAFGLQPIHFDEVESLYGDPLYEVDVFILIDARDDKHYTAGHVPGAYQIDYYFIDRYIDQVLPLAQGAEKVVIYCSGGDCEDSRLVAQALRDEYQIDPRKLFVYVGGFTEWRDRGMPVEKGPWGSGDITGGAK